MRPRTDTQTDKQTRVTTIHTRIVIICTVLYSDISSRQPALQSSSLHWGINVKKRLNAKASNKYNKSSAVAEIGDRGHNRHGPKKGGGAACAPFAER